MKPSDLHPVASEIRSAARHDLYVDIHKALRVCLTEALARVGALDPDDEQELPAALAQVEEMLDLVALHVEDENRFVHPVLAACLPGSADRSAHEHASHERAIASLRVATDALVRAGRADRPAALERLYRELALFLAEDLEHMHFEETHNMAVLWAHRSDDELLEIERAIVASIPPEMMRRFLHWMIPAVPHGRRVALLNGMRAEAPAAVFEDVVALARERLRQDDFTRLSAELGLNRPAAVARAA